MESVVDGLNQKVEKLRNSHEEKTKVVAMLEDQMRHIAEKQTEKEVELNQVSSSLRCHQGSRCGPFKSRIRFQNTEY